MGKSRGVEQASVDAVDLDAIQDKPRRPQRDFDSWCDDQDRQWSTALDGERWS